MAPAHKIPEGSARAARPTIDLYVTELVLDASHGGDRRRIAADLGDELVRLLEDPARGAGLSASRTVDRLDAGEVSEPTSRLAPRLGTTIARAVHGALQTS